MRQAHDCGVEGMQPAQSIVHPEIRKASHFSATQVALNQLANLESALISRRNQGLVAVCGPGGSGRTTLVREYARRAIDRKVYSGIWWLNGAGLVDFGGIERGLSDLSLLMMSMSIGHHDGGPSPRHAVEVIERLSWEQPWLLIYDDVLFPDKLREAQLLPDANAHAVCTCRITGPGIFSIDLSARASSRRSP